jgi:endonuclease YncB( thermonuclease family)
MAKETTIERLNKWFACTMGAVLLIAGLCQSIDGAEVTYGNLKRVQYVRNYDGDTVTFNIPNIHPVIGDKVSIRVRGIDTPEIRTKCEKEKVLGYKAKQVVADLFVGAKDITLTEVGRGKYFRLVANIIIDGTNLSQILLDKQLAVVYNGGTKTKNWCE